MQLPARLRLLVSLGFAALTALPASAQQPRPAMLNPRAEAILRELRDYSVAGVDRRFGPDYAAYHKGAVEKFPEHFLPEVKEEKKGRRYEIGGPWTKGGGDFSSTQGQILYVPDAGNFGVDRVTIIEWANGTFSERPEPPWNSGFRPEPTSKKWIAAAGGDPGLPIAMARGMAGWANCGVAIFSSGLIATAGTVTARGSDPTYQLPKNKLPTAISVTNKNEFALVTVVDTDTLKGQVAVFALESSGKKNHFAHEWQDDYPCVPNVAIFTNLKLLGYIDLPGMSFPTGICAVGSATTNRMNGRDGNAGLLREYSLDKQADRDVFAKGSNANYASKSGWAIVISKYDNKVAFLDLQPMFERVREMYFTTEENFQKTRNLGPEPKQWPFTFEADPTWAPKVVSVISQVEPTAVLASLGGGKKARGFVASRDGKIQIYEVGGLSTEEPADAAAIKNTGFVQVGRNPTCLAYQKLSNDTFIAVSRGDREIAWVRYADKDDKSKKPDKNAKPAPGQPAAPAAPVAAAAGTSLPPGTLQVFRRLRDNRLKDPVFVEVADTHGVSTPILTVTDFKGRQILNYRYGVCVFATQGGARFGMGADGQAEFECGGLMEFPGHPFCLSASNVN